MQKVIRTGFYANSMAGRHPFYSIEVPFTQKLFEQLIEIGADATGTDLDKELAAYYNYFFKTDKYPVPAADANGFYQYKLQLGRGVSPAGDGWLW